MPNHAVRQVVEAVQNLATEVQNMLVFGQLAQINQIIQQALDELHQLRGQYRQLQAE